METKRILFFGDSITDMNRNRELPDTSPMTKGFSYVFRIDGDLGMMYPNQYEVINRGISGNRIVDLYARVKKDVWNLKPDILSILIGVNDVWHEYIAKNGVDPERFEKVYSMLIEDTLKVLPEVKIVLLEPFAIQGEATDEFFPSLDEVYNMAGIVKKLAVKYNLGFIPLQEKIESFGKNNGNDKVLTDGVHPSAIGSKIIADAWLDYFEKNLK